MKNIIFTLLFAFSMQACSDFLDTRAYDFVSPEQFYQNQNDAQMALAGVYSAMATENVYGNRYSCMISNVDDLSFYVRPATQTVTHVYGNDHNTSNTDVYNAWSSLYKGIESANILLERIDNASIDEAVKTRIKGEAKFLRAYYHFLVVQAWKDVPIRKESFKDVSKSALQATPQAEALDWIISEMEETIGMVDDETYDDRPSYVKKTVVEGILARVCLTRAGYPTNGGQPYYEKAATYAKSVKDANKHALNPDVYEMWKRMASDRYDTEYNESMWEVEFIGARELNGNWTDGRIGNVIGNIQKNGSTEGLGYSYWFYGGSLILWDLFDSNDKRRDLSMAPYQIDAKDQYSYWKDSQIVQRACGKFRREWETLTPRHKNYTQENYPVIRYADVLLMAAELGSPGAQAYFDTVRKRAYTSNGLLSSSYTALPATKEYIMQERRLEFAFESINYWDLLRQGVDYAAGKLAAEVPVFSAGSPDRVIIRADRLRATKGISQIPYNQITLANGTLVQNPGW